MNSILDEKIGLQWPTCPDLLCSKLANTLIFVRYVRYISSVVYSRNIISVITYKSTKKILTDK